MPVFEDRVRQRVQGKVAQLLIDNHIKSVILAGGALLREYGDLDFYPTVEHKEPFDALVKAQKRITKNSASIIVDGQLVQLCRYFKEKPEDLIASFDYTHCQIAALIKFSDGPMEITILKTSGFSEAMESEGTAFTGSEYPLASMSRLFKVAQKRKLSRIDTAGTMIRVMCAILKRGYKDWDDFKDQLDAVDLALGVEDLAGYESDCTTLFDLVTRK